MSEIWLGISVVAILSATLCFVGVMLAKRISSATSHVLAFASVLAVIAFRFLLVDGPLLPQLLPIADLEIVGQALVPIGCFMAGLAWRLVKGPWWRKGLTSFTLVVVCLYASYGRLLKPTPTGGDVWEQDVCIQTSRASCAAAASATLLRAHGIEATEDEMIRLCLTRSGGTLLWGMYRGLKKKTAGTEWDVEVFSRDNGEGRSDIEGPALLSVGLMEERTNDPRYSELWGWQPGLLHAVVLFKIHDNGRVEVGDPSFGREFWSREDLDVLWVGVGLRLVKRD